MEKRSSSGDIIRGFAILCMIIGHSVIQHPINLFEVLWCSNLHALTADVLYNMPLFFFLSGYYYHCEEYGPYIQKKFMRVFLPYLIWAAVNDLIYVYGGAIVHETISLKEGIIAYLTGGHLWFLYVLFIVFLIYPLIEKVTYGSALLCIGCVLFSTVFGTPKGQLGNFISYLPYFITGHFCRKYSILKKGRLSDVVSSHRVILLTASVCFAAIIRLLYKLSGLYFLKFAGAFPVFLSLYIIASSPLFQNSSFVADAFISMGRYSLQIYLLNFYIIPVMKILVCRLLGISDPFIIVVSFTLVCIIPVIWACRFIIEKSKILRIAFGIPVNGKSIQ